MAKENFCCPDCGSDKSIPILWGYPSPGSEERAARGEIALGGCVIEDECPNRECPKCHTRFLVSNTRKFDSYIMVDWSASKIPTPNKPSPNSIWICKGDESGKIETYYSRTRTDAISAVGKWIRHSIRDSNRVLVGFDFAFGYPFGFSKAAFGAGKEKPWERIWKGLRQEVIDDSQAKGGFDRFEYAARLNKRVAESLSVPEGPFWSRPITCDAIKSHKPVPFPPLERLRKTEKQISGVQEIWKLYAPGSVGSQTLLGIPRVADLRFGEQFKDISEVWPFETGFSTGTKQVVFAEIWPGIVEKSKIAETEGRVRDEKQVKAMVKWCQEMDFRGQLFDLMVCPGGDDDMKQIAIAEEGWILGSKCPASTEGR